MRQTFEPEIPVTELSYDRKKQTVKSILFLFGQTMLFALVFTSCSYALFGQRTFPTKQRYPEKTIFDLNVRECVKNWSQEMSHFSVASEFESFMSLLMSDSNMSEVSVQSKNGIHYSRNNCSRIEAIASKLLFPKEEEEEEEEYEDEEEEEDERVLEYIVD